METTTKHNSLIGFTSILGIFKGIFVLLLMLLSTLTAGAETVTLTSSTGQVTLNDGDVVTGTGGVETRIQVAAGATVTLSGVTIYTLVNHENADYWWPTISCLGDAVIILGDGTNNLLKTNHTDFPVVTVAQGSTLTIRGNGSLEAYSCGYGAAIGSGAMMGCGNIVIESGNISAFAGYSDYKQGKRWGGEAAGIGTGYSGLCGDITISGGTVNATSYEAAGIGSSKQASCGNITITGGIVTATGGLFHFDKDSNSAPGIGSDYRGVCGNISINMSSNIGRVIAYRSANSPYSVGPGLSDDDGGSYCGTLTIDGVATDYITDDVFKYSKGIYDITYILDGGTNASSNPATYTIEDETFTIAEPTRFGYDFVGWTYGGQSTPVKRITIAHGSTGDKTLVANWTLAPIVTLTQEAGYWELQDGQTLTGTGGPDTHITIAAGATVTLSGVNLTTISDDNNHKWAGLTCVGDATIILADGTTNHVKGGFGTYPAIYVPAGNTLTIRGGGTLNAHGGSSAAGIGSSPNGWWCGNIVLDGGIINAAGGNEAAGIGSAGRGVCGDITITTGVTSVTASGGSYAASIGAGRYGSCGTVTIGGVVTGSIYGNFTYRPADNPAYIITFNANGGTGSMDDQQVLKNISIGLNDCTFTLEDYVFTGWNTEADGSGTHYANGQGITATGDVTLYAQWDHRDIYNVTFDANGGTGSMVGQVFRKHDPPQNLSTCTFTREGYAFVGWNTKANGSGTAYTDEQNTTATGDMTLYAQWRELLTVTFQANGGTGTMDSQTFIDGVPQSLSSCTFTAPSGYAFAGWNTEADGCGIAYAAGVDATLTGNITLYAQWQEAGTVTFDANGGTGTMANQVFGDNTLQALNVNTFTCDGYFFVGWNTKADGSGTAYADKASITVTADMTLYAQWALRSDRTIDVYRDITVTLNNGDMLTGTGTTTRCVTIADGATVIFSNVSLAQGGSNSCIICAGDATIILSGHNVVRCYSANIDGSAGIYIPEGKTLTIRGTGSLTAVGTSTSAGIGGSQRDELSCGNIVITSEVAVVSAETESGEYCIGPARNFDGINGTCGYVIIGGVETGPIAQKSFTYKATYNITFDANGGLGTMADQTFWWGMPQNLNACTIIREGYKFIGWNTAANGTGTAYTNEQAVTITSDMILYAQWGGPLTVTFDPNGSAGTMENQVFYEGISQNLNASTFTAPLGNIFNGWNTSRDGTGTAYTDEQAITITDNLTLYAQWAIPVWVNNNPLTWANRYDILGDGTMSFDPLTNTLTLDHPTQNVPIRSEGIDLTMKGFYKMTDEAGDVALDVVGGTLTLEGDFTLRGAVTGVQTGSDMNVKGQLRAYGTSSSGIHYTGSGNAWLTLQPGFIGTTRVEMQGGTDALSYTEGNVFRITTNGSVLSEPVGGHVVSSPDIFYIWEGGVAAKRAVFTIAGTANGEGTAESPFQILSSDDWTRACADVANGCETAGLYLAINSTITATTMMGTPDNPFAGVIDGERHYWNLTTSINKDVEGAALFRSVKGATIKNFCVEGSVIGGAASGGIVGQAVDGTTTIENCIFNGTVTTTTGEPAANFVCGNVASEATVTYNNCLDVTNLLWPATGTRAYSVTGVDATLTLTGTTGITWDNAIWAPEGATVEFTMTTLSGAEYVATGGTLTETDGTYSLVMPAQNVAMVPKYSLTYAITGNISTGGTVEINKAEAATGEPVCVTITPDPHYLRTELTVKDADDNEIPMTMYDEGFGFFTMPSGPVTVTVTFNKKYSFANGELRLLLGDFNNYGNDAFGTDVTGDRSAVLKVTAAEGVRFVGVCSSMFLNFSNCTEIDLSNVNTTAMTYTTSMFKGCTSLRKLNMTGWNMQQVEYMVGMFENCSSLREIDLSGINLNMNANMTEMFVCSGTNTGVCKLTLPAGMGVTASMYLNKGYYSGYYNGEYHNSGWQLLGDKTVVSGTDQYDGWTWATLPAQPTTATFVWSKMPEDFVLELPDGQDNSATVAAWDGVTTNVQLTGRKLWKDGDWNTICLPFLLGAYEIITNLGYPEIQGLETSFTYNASGETRWDEEIDTEEGYIYRTGFEESTGTLRLYFYNSDEIYPGTPYLIKWEKDTDNPYIESPTFTDVTIDTSSDDALVSKTVTSEDGKVQFKGTYDSRTFPGTDQSILFLGENNTLYYPGIGARIGAFRAYFQLTDPSATVKEFRLNFGETSDDADGIGLIHNSQFIIHNEGDWYDLNGRKLSGKPTQKGIYIHNGRKILK